MKKLLLVLSLSFLTSCASHYDDRKAAIESDYKAGKITTAEYHMLMNQTDSAESQHKAAAFQYMNSQQ
jgi:hypothetical protein